MDQKFMGQDEEKEEKDLSEFMGVDYDKLEEKMKQDGASQEEIAMTMSLIRLLRSRESGRR